MSINELSNEVSILKDEDKFRLICQIVGDMPAKSIRGLVKTVEDTFDVKVDQDSNFDKEIWTKLIDRPPITPPTPTEFDLVLSSWGESKLKVIRQVRSVTGLALREAKNLVDTVPSVLKKALPESEALALKSDFEKLGATIEVMATGEN